MKIIKLGRNDKVNISIVTGAGNCLMEVKGTFEQASYLINYYIDKNKKALEELKYTILIEL